MGKKSKRSKKNQRMSARRKKTARKNINAALKDRDTYLAQVLQKVEHYLRDGQDNQAEEYSRDIIAGAKTDFSFFCGVAMVFADYGNISFAAELMSRALEIAPDHPDCLSCAGWVQLKAGNASIAADCFHAALQQDSCHVKALKYLSNLLIMQQQWSDALGYLQRLNKIVPDTPSVLLALGTAWLQVNKPGDALPVLRRCKQLQPNCVEALINLGVAQRMLKRYEQSELTFLAVLKKHPERIEALHAISSLYTDWYKFDEAMEYSQRALAIEKNDINALNSLAYLYLKMGAVDRARQTYERALSLDSTNARTRLGYGALRMLQGDLQSGTPFYESRFDIMQSWLDGPWPIWDGLRPEGKTILVRAEQGVGDTLQFCRFLPLLQKAGANVIFSCQPSLGRLMEHASGIDKLYPVKELPVVEIHADAQVALLSLMGVFGITLEILPAIHCPYLSVEELHRQKMGEIFNQQDKLKVGLIWAGNPNQTDDHNRSLHLKQFVELQQFTDEIQFYSLQVGYAAEQIEEIGEVLEIIDLSPHIDDFADTAALMEHLDLVVSVCTSTIHLAGALARPAVVLLPFAADWRWFLGRDDSPWYPTVQLLRQSAPGQWEPVIHRLTERLKTLVKMKKNAEKRKS